MRTVELKMERMMCSLRRSEGSSPWEALVSVKKLLPTSRVTVARARKTVVAVLLLMRLRAVAAVIGVTQMPVMRVAVAMTLMNEGSGGAEETDEDDGGRDEDAWGCCYALDLKCP